MYNRSVGFPDYFPSPAMPASIWAFFYVYLIQNRWDHADWNKYFIAFFSMQKLSLLHLMQSQYQVGLSRLTAWLTVKATGQSIGSILQMYPASLHRSRRNRPTADRWWRQWTSLRSASGITMPPGLYATGLTIWVPHQRNQLFWSLQVRPLYAWLAWWSCCLYGAHCCEENYLQSGLR